MDNNDIIVMSFVTMLVEFFRKQFAKLCDVCDIDVHSISQFDYCNEPLSGTVYTSEYNKHQIAPLKAVCVDFMFRDCEYQLMIPIRAIGVIGSSSAAANRRSGSDDCILTNRTRGSSRLCVVQLGMNYFKDGKNEHLVQLYPQDDNRITTGQMHFDRPTSDKVFNAIKNEFIKINNQLQKLQ